MAVGIVHSAYHGVSEKLLYELRRLRRDAGSVSEVVGRPLVSLGARTAASTTFAACWVRKSGGKVSTRKLSEGGCALSVGENKAVVRRFFEEVFNQKQPELIAEVSGRPVTRLPTTSKRPNKAALISLPASSAKMLLPDRSRLALRT
jgi:hypothetical protein